MYTLARTMAQYGSRSVPFTSLAKIGGYTATEIGIPLTINCVDDVDLDKVQREIGITVFDKHYDLRIIKNAPWFNDKGRLVCPESITIWGDGIMIVWERDDPCGYCGTSQDPNDICKPCYDDLQPCSAAVDDQ